MAKVLKGTHTDGTDYYLVHCEGCGHAHCYDLRWLFNGDVEFPTFIPSFMSKAPYGKEQIERVCHSFVTDGMIQYLSDCTHELAGKTVELKDFSTYSD